MILTITASFDESVLNSALLAKIEQLETELNLANCKADIWENNAKQIVKTQFPKTWFGSRLGHSKDGLVNYLKINKITTDENQY